MLYYTLTNEFKTDSDDFEKYDKPNTLTIKVGNLPDILKWSSENNRVKIVKLCLCYLFSLFNSL